MFNMFYGLDLNMKIMLFLTLILILFYEIINGFHDTSNSISCVIYTKTLKAKFAVIMSGILNFFGVLMGGLSVAYTIVHILPNDLILKNGPINNLIIIVSILITSILWNIITWYLGLPISSSHTLIGSIIGINITNTLINNYKIIKNINIYEIFKIITSLVISPILGLTISGIILIILKFLEKKNIYKDINLTPKEKKKKYGNDKPNLITKFFLIISAASVSFCHGANDGQKGIGLIMLMLIGITPANFALNINSNYKEINNTINAINSFKFFFIKNNNIYKFINNKYKKLELLYAIKISLKLIKNIKTFKKLNLKQRFFLRHLLIYINNTSKKNINLKILNIYNKKLIENINKNLLCTVEYAPLWVIMLSAISLSLGTMIGWRKVVKTIGEKISKKELTYAQGLSAQITTSISIGIASYNGVPVSTTHILTSAVTGAVFIDGGKIQKKTLTNILITWIVTLPFTIILSSILYLIISIII